MFSRCESTSCTPLQVSATQSLRGLFLSVLLAHIYNCVQYTHTVGTGNKTHPFSCHKLVLCALFAFRQIYLNQTTTYCTYYCTTIALQLRSETQSLPCFLLLESVWPQCFDVRRKCHPFRPGCRAHEMSLGTQTYCSSEK